MTISGTNVNDLGKMDEAVLGGNAAVMGILVFVGCAAASVLEAELIALKP